MGPTMMCRRDTCPLPSVTQPVLFRELVRLRWGADWRQSSSVLAYECKEVLREVRSKPLLFQRTAGG